MLDGDNRIKVHKKDMSKLVHKSGFNGNEEVLSRAQINELNSCKNETIKTETKNLCKSALSEFSFSMYDNAYQFVCLAIKEIEKMQGR